jgi:hypothetical protein
MMKKVELLTKINSSGDVWKTKMMDKLVIESEFVEIYFNNNIFIFF